MLTAIAESIGCSGLSAGATDPKSDTAEVFGCWAGYEYRACAGVALAANVTQNPCTLDGGKCGRGAEGRASRSTLWGWPVSG